MTGSESNLTIGLLPPPQHLASGLPFQNLMANRQQGIKKFSSEFENKQTFPFKYNDKSQKVYLLQQTFIDPGGVSVATSCQLAFDLEWPESSGFPGGYSQWTRKQTPSHCNSPLLGTVYSRNKLIAGSIFLLCLMYVCERREWSPLPGGRLEINGQWQTSRQLVVLATTFKFIFQAVSAALTDKIF